MSNETVTISPLYMDRDAPLGNSLDSDGRRAIHTKIKNTPQDLAPLATFGAIRVVTSWYLNSTNASTQSTPFSAVTTTVRVFCTKDTFVAFGPNPTATGSSCYLPAGIVMDYAVTAGDKLAVLRVSANGVLYVTEGTA